jgi:hypothetical protein
MTLTGNFLQNVGDIVHAGLTGHVNREFSLIRHDTGTRNEYFKTVEILYSKLLLTLNAVVDAWVEFVSMVEEDCPIITNQ